MSRYVMLRQQRQSRRPLSRQGKQKANTPARTQDERVDMS
jgi:hypothetical protein